MPLEAVLLDLDRTLTYAEDLRVVPAALLALGAARRAGVRVVIVSGRSLGSIEHEVGEVADALVAENGAILRFPDGTTRELATRLPRIDVEIAIERGTVISSVAIEHEPLMRAAFERAGVRATLIRNRDRVMALPEGVDKAAGALEALRVLGIDPANAVAFGDGENDLVLLKAVGRGVAVANAVPALLDAAAEVTREEGGEGVAEWLRAHLEAPA